MGWDPWKPYQYLDNNKKLVGLDIKLIGSTIEHMGCEIKYVKIPWKRLLLSVKDGSIDFAAGVSKTNERSAWGYFSHTYRKSDIGLFILKEDKHKYPYDSLTTLFKNIRFSVGMLRGAYIGEEVKMLLNNPKTRESFELVSIETQNPKKLLVNRIDGFLADKVTGRQYLRELEGLYMAVIHPMHVFSSDLHLLFSKQSTSQKLVDKFNKSLSVLQKNGAHQKIFNEYK